MICKKALEELEKKKAERLDKEKERECINEGICPKCGNSHLNAVISRYSTDVFCKECGYR